MSLSEAHFKRINGILYKFIWNRHFLAAKAPERIRRTIVNKSLRLGGLGMLDIGELDASLKLKALGRLKSSAHPFLCLIRNKLNLEEFFFPIDKCNLDEIASQAISVLKRDRQKLWQVEQLHSNRQYINAIKTSKIWSALTANGRQSLAYLRIRLNGKIYLDELNETDKNSLRPFLNPDLLKVLNATSRINRNFVAGLDPINYSIVKNDKFYSLEKLTSKQIRDFRADNEPVTEFKIGVTLNPPQALTWGHNLRKVTSTRHKDLILRLAHGEIYSKEKLHRFRLIDDPSCPRCGGIETLRHKFLECPYVMAIWSKVLVVTDKIKTSTDTTEPLADRILSTTAPNPLVITIHAEVIMKIKGLRDDQNFLLRPNVIIKNALNLIGKREVSDQNKRAVEQMLQECN